MVLSRLPGPAGASVQSHSLDGVLCHHCAHLKVQGVTKGCYLQGEWTELGHAVWCVYTCLILRRSP